MKPLFFTGIFALAIGTTMTPAFSQSNMKLEKIGHIKATLDGKSRQWHTFSSKADGETVASANWQRMSFTVPDMSELFSAMADSMSPAQRAQMEALTSASGPMAQAMAQMSGMTSESTAVTLTISGMDPDSPDQLRERVLALDIYLEDPNNVSSGTPYAADVNYVLDASAGPLSQVLYISDYDGNDGTVIFDKLDLQPGGGHASGQFKASMCRLDMKRIMDGPDLSDCVQVDGTFDTELLEESGT